MFSGGEDEGHDWGGRDIKIYMSLCFYCISVKWLIEDDLLLRVRTDLQSTLGSSDRGHVVLPGGCSCPVSPDWRIRDFLHERIFQSIRTY